MTTFNFNVELEELNDNQRNALSNFVQSFNKGATINSDVTGPGSGSAPMIIDMLGNRAGEQPVTEEKKKRAPRGSKAQAGAFEGQERTESAVDEYEAAKEAPVTDATDAEDNDLMGDEAPKLTFDDLRAVTSSKTQADRANVDLLRAKIKELGGEKLVDLQDKPQVWQKFIDYANTL